MHPDLTIPILGLSVKSYGAMLAVGFLTGVWLAMRRAERMKADPNVVIDIGFVCLVCGVLGGRFFFVVHYWESSFAHLKYPLLEAAKIWQGGLEYYGGLIGAIVGTCVYVAVKRVSLRMYLDILAPAAMWGLAFGRIGCLLNGCCWGGLCVDAHGHQTVRWGIQFPHGSAPQARQWENRQLTVPAELIFTEENLAEPFLVRAAVLSLPVEEREGPFAEVRRVEKQLATARTAGQDSAQIQSLEDALKTGETRLRQHRRDLADLFGAMRFPSRLDPTRATTVSELEALAASYHTKPVHPAQVYATINALLLSWVLWELLARRKRHGVVFATMCILYPITRAILETVRVDNPHDSAGLTISQAVSVGMVAFGIAMLIALRRMPLRSPLAVPYEPPLEESGDVSTA